MRIKKFEVWKTIKIGTYQGAFALQSALKKGGFIIGEFLTHMFTNNLMTCSIKERQVNLVKVRVRELGFRRKPGLQDICARAEKKGLKLCYSEIAVQLRMQYVEQPHNEILRIAIRPVMNTAKNAYVLSVSRNGGLPIVDGVMNKDSQTFALNDLFIFRLPEQNMT